VERIQPEATHSEAEIKSDSNQPGCQGFANESESMEYESLTERRAAQDESH